MMKQLVLTAFGVLQVHVCTAADTGPADAAVQQVFKQTVEQARAVELKPGQRCTAPAVQRFKVLKRGVLRKSAELPNGYYPVDAQVDLQCRQQAGGEVSQWSGQVELLLYQNALQLWTVRW